MNSDLCSCAANALLTEPFPPSAPHPSPTLLKGTSLPGPRVCVVPKRPSPGKPLFEVSLESTCSEHLGVFQKQRMCTQVMMKLIRSWGYLARCVHNSGRTRPSPARLLCGEGCCLPGFCPGQICIHLMDCWGRGSPPWEAVECLLRAVEKGCPVFAQALEMPGAFRGARSIRGTLRSLGHSSREPFSLRTSF